MRLRRFIKGGLVLLLLLAVAVIGTGYYLLGFSLQPENRGRDIEASRRYMYANYPYLENWTDSLNRAAALEDTFLLAEDGMRLHAYYIAAGSPTDKTAVIVHGYTDNAVRMFMIGYLYSHELGFNVLLPDLRNTGLSDGDHIQMGWRDRLDVLRWMETANTLFGDSVRMVVHGISMGAATTMMTAGIRPQPDYVKCYVEDCGYTSVWDQFAYQLKEQFHLPSFPLMHVASWLCRLKFGWDFREASALEQVAHSRLPMLFIHGDADTFVPTEMVYRLYEAKPEPKELWLVPGSGHALSYKDYTEEYTEKVGRFVGRYIP